MFEKVLIANRGEIALRVARACHELGIACVAVYSTADAESAVVRFADEAVQIGPPAVGRSYLHIPSLIGAALKTSVSTLADAWPGTRRAPRTPRSKRRARTGMFRI